MGVDKFDQWPAKAVLAMCYWGHCALSGRQNRKEKKKIQASHSSC